MYEMRGDGATPPSGFGFWGKLSITAAIAGGAVWLFATGAWPSGLVFTFLAVGWSARTLNAHRRWKNGDPLFPMGPSNDGGERNMDAKESPTPEHVETRLRSIRRLRLLWGLIYVPSVALFVGFWLADGFLAALVATFIYALVLMVIPIFMIWGNLGVIAARHWPRRRRRSK